jgi:L-rhamnose isomerase
VADRLAPRQRLKDSLDVNSDRYDKKYQLDAVESNFSDRLGKLSRRFARVLTWDTQLRMTR